MLLWDLVFGLPEDIRNIQVVLFLEPGWWRYLTSGVVVIWSLICEIMLAIQCYTVPDVIIYGMNRNHLWCCRRSCYCGSGIILWKWPFFSLIQYDNSERLVVESSCAGLEERAWPVIDDHGSQCRWAVSSAWKVFKLGCLRSDPAFRCCLVFVYLGYTFTFIWLQRFIIAPRWLVRVGYYTHVVRFIWTINWIRRN